MELPDNLVSVSQTVFNYASNGTFTALKKLLDSEALDVRRKIVSRPQSDGEICLVSAAKGGHAEIVKYLIEECGADLEQTGSVEFDSERVEGVTALWCASASGALNVVRYLVEKNACINRRTITNSTPLRAACFDGHLKVVQFLVENGADLEIPNRHGHTCLMIACFKQKHQVVEYLIKKGARINRQSSKGNTALHDCAESGNLQSLQLLLNNGAIMRREEHGLSPIMSAGNAGFAQIVKELRNHRQVPIIDVIHALELLGAYYLDKESRRDWALEKFNEALQLREKHNLPKDPLLPLGWFTPAEELEIEQEDFGMEIETDATPLLETKNLLGKENHPNAGDHFDVPVDPPRLNPPEVRPFVRTSSFKPESPWKNCRLYYADGYYFICTDYQRWLRCSSTPPGYHCHENFPSSIATSPTRFRNLARYAFEHVHSEFCSLDELNAATAEHPDLIFFHALLLRLRILGPEQPEFLYHLRFRGAALADSGYLQQCIHMWLYALELVRRYLEPLHQVVHTSFHSCLNLFYFILSDRYELFSPRLLAAETLLSTLEMGVGAIARASKWYYDSYVLSGAPWAYTQADKESKNLQTLCVSVLGIIYLLMEYYEGAPELHERSSVTAYGRSRPLDTAQRTHFYRLVHTLVSLRPTVIEGNTLLHLAFTKESARLSRSNFITDNKAPLLPVGLLLLKVGHSTCQRNAHGQQPLCILLDEKKGVEDVHNAYLGAYLPRLAVMGVHLDCSDRFGLGHCMQRLRRVEQAHALHLSANSTASLAPILSPLPFQLHRHLTLQCFAAKCVRKHGILTRHQVERTTGALKILLELH